MRHSWSFPWLFLVVLLAGCAAFRFEPGLSMNDPVYFSEPPHIVARPDGYRLAWRYGTWGFYFHPESKVMDGSLVFALRGLTSTGSATGKYEEIPITDRRRIHALETGGAFWLEPDGQRVRLELRR